MAVKNCPQCKGKLEKVVFDIGYGVQVESAHCPKCGYNLTEGKKLGAAIGKLREQMCKEVKIIQVGAGLGIRFPNEIVKSYHLKRGMCAVMKPAEKCIEIVP